MVRTGTGAVAIKRSGKFKVHFGRSPLGLRGAPWPSVGALRTGCMASGLSQTLSSSPSDPWLHEGLQGWREMTLTVPPSAHLHFF